VPDDRDDAGALGLTPGATEFNANPLFLDRVGEDFRLSPASVAIDAATNLGYTLDFDDNTVPNGPAPDIGAYELVFAQQACTIVTVPTIIAYG